MDDLDKMRRSCKGKAYIFVVYDKMSSFPNTTESSSSLVTVTGPSVDLFLISRRSTVYLEVDTPTPRSLKKVSLKAQLLELVAHV